MEASYPARFKEKAMLSISGLSGCFCFRFMYNMYVDDYTELKVYINGKEAMGKKGISLNWHDYQIDVNEDGNVKVSCKIKIFLKFIIMGEKCYKILNKYDEHGLLEFIQIPVALD